MRDDTNGKRMGLDTFVSVKERCGLTFVGILIHLLLWQDVGLALSIQSDTLSRIVQDPTIQDTVKFELIFDLGTAELSVVERKIGRERLEETYTWGMEQLNGMIFQKNEKAGDYVRYCIAVSDHLGDAEKKAKSRYLAGSLMYYQGQPDSALYYYMQASNWMKKTNHYDLLADYYNSIGKMLYQTSLFEEALGYFTKSKNIYDSIGQTDLAVRAMNNMGIMYRRLGMMDSTLAIQMKALEVATQLNDGRLMAVAYGNLGNFYYVTGKYSIALEYFLKSIEAHELVLMELDTVNNQKDYQQSLQSLINGYGNLAQLYAGMDEESKREEYLTKALGMSQRSSEKYKLPQLLNGFGNLELKRGNIDKAIDYFEKAKAYHVQFGSTSDVAVSLMALGRCYKKLGEYTQSIQLMTEGIKMYNQVGSVQYLPAAHLELAEDHLYVGHRSQALRHAKRAFELSKEIDDPVVFEGSAHWLQKYYEQQENFKEALSYAMIGQQAKEKIWNEKNNKEIGRIEAAHELAKKEEEKKRLEQEITRKELIAELAETRSNFTMALGGLLLLIVFAILWQARSRIKYQNLMLAKEKELNETKSRFFANVSHEFRTPLTLISGPLQDLAADDKISKKSQALISSATKYSQQLLGLNTEIMELSKLEAGAVKVDKQPLMIYHEMVRIAEAYRSFCELKNQDYQVEINCKEDLCVEMDRDKLEKILNNLIGNAIKYTPKEGRVALKAALSPDQKNIIVKISDSGRGIDDADKKYIFDRYYQSHTQNAVLEGGLGIGLAIVKEMVQLMGGSISVKSSLNQGSIFTVLLPTKVIHAAGNLLFDTTSSTHRFSEGMLEEPEPMISEDTPMILVVEDHEDMRRYIENIIRPYYRFRGAANGLEAREMLKGNDHGISLIISDVMMPEMDGFALLEHIKKTEQLAALPVIMLTARAEMEDKIDAWHIGVDDYMTKPFDAQELLARVRNLLVNFAQRREASGQASSPEDEAGSLSANQRFMKEVERILRREVSNSAFTLADLAIELRVSQRTIHRRIKQVIGMNSLSYFREIRLVEAHDMLISGKYRSVAEICFAVGFENPGYFAKVYYDRFGKKPSNYLYDLTE